MRQYFHHKFTVFSVSVPLFVHYSFVIDEKAVEQNGNGYLTYTCTMYVAALWQLSYIVISDDTAECIIKMHLAQNVYVV